MVSQNTLQMPTEIFAPSFISTSKAAEFGSDDLLDFDLLADYLLDDGGPSSAFFDDDFMSESVSDSPETEQDGSNMVSPDLRNSLLVDDIPAIQHTRHAPETPVGFVPAPLVPNRGAIPPFIPTSTAPRTANASDVHTNVNSTTSYPNKRVKLDNPQAALNSQFVVDEPDSPGGGGGKSKAQVDRRRERNRILARRTRLRKKFFFESLQKEVTDLQRENMALKELVSSRLDSEVSKKILDKCKATEELPDIVLEHIGDPNYIARQDFNLINSIKQSQQSFIITDPSLQDNPIVYASGGFIELSGYNRNEILGRNCRFLQGPGTDRTKIATIRKAIANGDDVTVTLINYMADGTPFWNKLFVAALRDAENNIVNFIGVCVKVAAPDKSDSEAGKELPLVDSPQKNDKLAMTTGDVVDIDATVTAIEGAVEKAVAAAPTMVHSLR